MLERWCTCVMRAKADPVKRVVGVIRLDLQGTVVWDQTLSLEPGPQALIGRVIRDAGVAESICCLIRV